MNLLASSSSMQQLATHILVKHCDDQQLWVAHRHRAAPLERHPVPIHVNLKAGEGGGRGRCRWLPAGCLTMPLEPAKGMQRMHTTHAQNQSQHSTAQHSAARPWASPSGGPACPASPSPCEHWPARAAGAPELGPSSCRQGRRRGGRHVSQQTNLISHKAPTCSLGWHAAQLRAGISPLQC